MEDGDCSSFNRLVATFLAFESSKQLRTWERTRSDSCTYGTGVDPKRSLMENGVARRELSWRTFEAPFPALVPVVPNACHSAGDVRQQHLKLPVSVHIGHRYLDKKNRSAQPKHKIGTWTCAWNSSCRPTATFHEGFSRRQKRHPTPQVKPRRPLLFASCCGRLARDRFTPARHFAMHSSAYKQNQATVYLSAHPSHSPAPSFRRT